MAKRREELAPDIKVVLSLDAANATGWAITSVEGKPRLCAYGEIKGRTDDVRLRYIRGAFAEISEAFDGDVVRAVIEDQYLEKGGSVSVPGRGTFAAVSPKSLRAVLKLRRVVGWYEAMCSVYGWPVEFVDVAAWRRDIYGPQLTKGLDREGFKLLSKQLVRAQYPAIGELSDNVCEAILIGARAAKKEWLAQLRKARR